jgi:hypothetical protein
MTKSFLEHDFPRRQSVASSRMIYVDHPVFRFDCGETNPRGLHQRECGKNSIAEVVILRSCWFRNVPQEKS